MEEEISTWEGDNGEEFLILGLRLKDYVKYVQEQYELEKQQVCEREGTKEKGYKRN